ncbi:MAG: DUF6266 family protein [Tannerella sp.]|jgi:hypothetical protein|nr:DUF6266 family protein [Tannerella sp.]
MAKVYPFSIGVFSGTLGDVVYATWKGIPYIRSKPAFVVNPRTEAQQSQRAKFTLAIRFLKSFADFIRMGYKKYAIKKTAFNAAMSYTLGNAIVGNYPDYRIDYSRVLVSRGALTSAVNVQAGIEGGAVRISWNDNSTLGFAKSTDNALAIVINPDKVEAVYKTAGAPRGSGMETLDIPTGWTGDQVEVYLGFISDNGKEVSNSVYAGSLIIP